MFTASRQTDANPELKQNTLAALENNFTPRFTPTSGYLALPPATCLAAWRKMSPSVRAKQDGGVFVRATRVTQAGGVDILKRVGNAVDAAGGATRWRVQRGESGRRQRLIRRVVSPPGTIPRNGTRQSESRGYMPLPDIRVTRTSKNHSPARQFRWQLDNHGTMPL